MVRRPCWPSWAPPRCRRRCRRRRLGPASPTCCRVCSGAVRARARRRREALGLGGRRPGHAAGAGGGPRGARRRPGRRAGPGLAPLLLILVMSALSLVPFALLMTTCFVKVAVVLSILRSAIGTPQVPPTPVITGLALILTVYVMAPPGARMYDAVKPVLALGRTSADLAHPQTLDQLA